MAKRQPISQREQRIQGPHRTYSAGDEWCRQKQMFKSSIQHEHAVGGPEPQAHIPFGRQQHEYLATERRIVVGQDLFRCAAFRKDRLQLIYHVNTGEVPHGAPDSEARRPTVNESEVGQSSALVMSIASLCHTLSTLNLPCFHLKARGRWTGISHSWALPTAPGAATPQAHFTVRNRRSFRIACRMKDLRHFPSDVQAFGYSTFISGFQKQ
ncbi:hypothetical protein M514_08804 [Trichuris suis]|uniref:Uncharacterized protein n=1 Tax=Trichuris suis TaxID=68888 RepID=A0A085LZA8_9BILA|nr:hypothetical protein M513_08804 [Trichuris suis]KFD69535.1 hypothetical protein M514_08804 [Trichuris suis]